MSDLTDRVKIDLDDLEKMAKRDALRLDGLHGDPSKLGGWVGHRNYARNVVALIARIRELENETNASDFVPWPKDQPARHNGSGEPCDMWIGPCSCGATHTKEQRSTGGPMTTDRPSIAELQKIARRSDGPGDWRWEDNSACREALPALLEIAAAALAWRDQRFANLQAALMRTESEIEAEEQDVSLARAKRTAELAKAIETALAKVKP